MTLQNINNHFVVPVFFFLAVMSMTLTLVWIISSVTQNPSFLVLAGVAFVLGYNAFLIGMKLKSRS